MKIELLYPEVCSLFGESGSIRYIEEVFCGATIYKTELNEVPHFVNESIDFIYLGPMTENTQKKVITKLTPYVNKLKNTINSGVHILFVGNAVDILGNSIEFSKENIVNGLGILDFTVKVNFLQRFNCMMLTEYNNHKLMGFKTQFSEILGNNNNNHFAQVTKGMGLNKNSKFEGFKINNFIATQMIGPILMINPYFTKELFESIAKRSIELPYFDLMINNYNAMLKDYNNVSDSGL